MLFEEVTATEAAKGRAVVGKHNSVEGEDSGGEQREAEKKEEESILGNLGIDASIQESWH